MCKVSKYPGLYSNANEVLRREGINPSMPGYEFLKRAIVIYKVEGMQKKEKFLSDIKEGRVIPANKCFNFEDKRDRKEGLEERDEVEQWMIEAAKSAGVDIPLMQYIKQLSEELKS